MVNRSLQEKEQCAVVWLAKTYESAHDEVAMFIFHDKQTRFLHSYMEKKTS